MKKKYGKQFWVEELGEKWAMNLKDLLKTEYGDTTLMEFINIEYAMNPVAPVRNKLFEAFKLCPWDSLKIVILGSEPHIASNPNGLAYGDCFTSQFHSAQLTTVFDCIEKQYHACRGELYFDFDFTLEHWARQGVLLLNRSLSRRVNSPGSHKKPWGKFNSAVLNSINDYKPGTIFVLWGKEAQALEPHIKSHNYILKYDSPEEAFDKEVSWDCPNFKEIDNILKKLYGESITW